MIQKGYTLHITSWENDGDNYQLNQLTVETLDEVKKLHIVCTELLASENSSPTGVGNSSDYSGFSRLIDFAEKYPQYFPDCDGLSNDELFEYFQALTYPLVGESDFYDFRVCESIQITYSPDNVYNEFIIL